MRLACAVVAMTGMTLIPASRHMGRYSVGLPAPVVTTLTSSSTTSLAISGVSGSMSMMLQPKGLSVCALACLTCSAIQSSLAPPQAMMPRPPASLTAAASEASGNAGHAALDDGSLDAQEFGYSRFHEALRPTSGSRCARRCRQWSRDRSARQSRPRTGPRCRR